MPALSPTMETGTLSKWLVAVGDTVKSGDVLAEIETDKATMEVESIDEGIVAELLVEAGTEGVPVGQVIMRLSGDGEVAAKPAPAAPPAVVEVPKAAVPVAVAPAAAPTPAVVVASKDGRINASPLARRIAQVQGVELAAITGSGPNGRIVRADVEAAAGKPVVAAAAPVAAVPAPMAAPAAPAAPFTSDIPHVVEKLGNVRKVRRSMISASMPSAARVFAASSATPTPME
ncbi:MAG: hypothetical protein B7Z20_12135 [Sphingobium sp. 32-64-5]|nr:MAG: hypothetical protein B7Z20_12135 [Sphingobium sp. 32-64-5]